MEARFSLIFDGIESRKAPEIEKINIAVAGAVSVALQANDVLVGSIQQAARPGMMPFRGVYVLVTAFRASLQAKNSDGAFSVHKGYQGRRYGFHRRVRGRTLKAFPKFVPGVESVTDAHISRIDTLNCKFSNHGSDFWREICHVRELWVFHLCCSLSALL